MLDYRCVRQNSKWVLINSKNKKKRYHSWRVSLSVHQGAKTRDNDGKRKTLSVLRWFRERKGTK